MKIRNINIWMAVCFFLLGLIIGAGVVYGALKYSEKPSDNKINQAPAPKKYSFDLENVVVLGNPDAKVSIVEFSDYQCPACGAFFKQIFPQLKVKYIDTGEVNFTMKDFPLFSMHPQAEKASEASHCAREQGKFWEMHEMLFNDAKLWSGNKKADSVFTDFAKKLSLNTKQFSDCLAKNKYQQVVLDSLKEGINADIEGTPTFYINGEKTFFGVYPMESFNAVIQKLIGS